MKTYVDEIAAAVRSHPADTDLEKVVALDVTARIVGGETIADAVTAVRNDIIDMPDLLAYLRDLEKLMARTQSRAHSKFVDPKAVTVRFFEAVRTLLHRLDDNASALSKAAKAGEVSPADLVVRSSAFIRSRAVLREALDIVCALPARGAYADVVVKAIRQIDDVDGVIDILVHAVTDEDVDDKRPHLSVVGD